VEEQKAFRILVTGSSKWINGATVQSALERHCVYQAVGMERRVTVACGDKETGTDRLCREIVARMRKHLCRITLEMREPSSLEYPVGFDVVLGFPVEPGDWEILRRANLLGVEVQVFPESSR
jgi:hypothetical protein